MIVANLPSIIMEYATAQVGNSGKEENDRMLVHFDDWNHYVSGGLVHVNTTMYKKQYVFIHVTIIIVPASI